MRFHRKRRWIALKNNKSEHFVVRCGELFLFKKEFCLSMSRSGIAGDARRRIDIRQINATSGIFLYKRIQLYEYKISPPVVAVITVVTNIFPEF